MILSALKEVVTFYKASLVFCFAFVFATEAIAEIGIYTQEPSCHMPTDITTLFENEGAVLEVWSIPLSDVDHNILPEEPAFVTYRKAVQKMGADKWPPKLLIPETISEKEAVIWQNEQLNNERVLAGEIGVISPISCLDALLFSRQESRFPQLEHATEFIASVLHSETNNKTMLVVVFGAGSELFPPKEVHGFDIVETYIAAGWSYWYMIHNHTIQNLEGQQLLGVPAPSTSDVQFARGLAVSLGLEAIRVTNGFYTFHGSIKDLTPLSSR